MKGIILASHGSIAKGMFKTSHLFMGDEIPQYTYLSLHKEDSAESFGEELEKKIQEVDTGDGVIVFVDLLGGTPYNQACLRMSGKVQIIAGMNVSMILELLGNREENENNIFHLIEVGKDGIVDVNKFFEEME